MTKFLACSKYVVAVCVEKDAPIRQFRKRVEVGAPFSFGVKHGLMAMLPELLDDRAERRPIVGLELRGLMKGTQPRCIQNRSGPAGLDPQW
jgi:hypothetical protein